MSASKPATSHYLARSMTAFSRVQKHTTLGRYSWEVRSVNQRYLEINPRLPDAFRHLETALREQTKQQVFRGKLDISLSIETLHNPNAMQVNQNNLDSLKKAINQVQNSLESTTNLNPLEVLQWPGILNANTNQTQTEQLDTELIESLHEALVLLNEHRTREGQALAHTINERCANITQHIKTLEQALPAILEKHSQKLTQRIAQLTQQLDENRFLQEVATIAHKMDISEEIDRLKIHIAEVHHILITSTQAKTAAPIGRRLDFLMQELNREANTIGSKSIDSQTSQTSVELKVLIEQMREQVQNIE